MAKRKKGVINHYDFVRDLGRGAIGEDVVVAFFRREFGLTAENLSAKNPDFDLKISELDPEMAKKKKVVPKKLLKKIFRDLGFPKNTDLTVEVKFDEAAARYKNFFIEIFFDIDKGVPGGVFKCKADMMAWVVPARGKFRIFLFNRPALLAWVFRYVFESEKKLKFKTPGISPQARGLAIPITIASKCSACIGEYELKL